MLDSLSQLGLHLTGLSPNPVLVFGLLLLLGVAGGILAHRISWLPTITAFMLLGAITGPYGLGIITKPMLYDSRFLIDVALGLILYRLGNMLHPKEMLSSRRLMLTSLMESTLSFLAVYLLMQVMTGNIALSVVIGAIAISSSPAVLVHVAEELNARGMMTERAKSLVALNNIFSFVIFSSVMPLVLSLQPSALDVKLLSPLYSLAGSALIGGLCGVLAAGIARFLAPEDEHYRFVIVIGAIMLTIGLSMVLSTSLLFGPLVLGMVTRAMENETHPLSKTELGAGGDLFYIILFVMAGAKIDFSAVLSAGILPLALIIARVAGKTAGLFFAAQITGASKVQAASSSLMLLPMAGMAIGLVATVGNYVPGLGTELAAIVFAMVAVFETIGPFAVVYALRLCGEAHPEESRES